MKKIYKALLVIGVLAFGVGAFFGGYNLAYQMETPKEPVEAATIDQAIFWMTDCYWRHKLVIEHPEDYDLKAIGDVDFHRKYTRIYQSVILLLESFKNKY